MNTALITNSFKKELWEFHKTLFWLPLIIAALIVITPFAQLMLLEDYQVNKIFMVLEELHHATQLDQLSNGTLAVVNGLFVPFLMIGFVIQLYYFVNCLFDERRDLSVYFWRSLPVSDATTVGVKLLTGALVIPAIFMVGATLSLLVYAVMAFVACIVLAAGYDISLWHLWGHADILSTLAGTWLTLLPYALWMFPVYAWLMLASMFAKKAPFLWAVIPVAAILVVEAFIVEYFHLRQGFFSETLIEYFGFMSDMHGHHIEIKDPSKLSLAQALSEKVSLMGVLLGAAFIGATYWLRSNRSHP